MPTHPAPSMLFVDGFTAVFDPCDICQDRTRLCFHAFAKGSWRPVHRTGRTMATTTDGRLQDYIVGSWLQGSWCGVKQDERRQLDPEERAVQLDMPPTLSEAFSLQLEQKKVTQINNTVVGCAFHVPSVMLVLIVLCPLQPTIFQMPHATTDLQEQNLTQRMVLSNVFRSTPSDVVSNAEKWVLFGSAENSGIGSWHRCATASW